jgi:Protein of unknown function (DUF2809)
MPSRQLLLSLALMLATIAVGLAVRFAPLGLPLFAVKYGGSMLWALMVYWIVSTMLPSWRLPAVALLTGVLATAVEFAKLYHSPGLDAFRLTLPGVLLLGRFFSGWDIAAYWLAIVAGALVDQRIRLRPQSRQLHAPLKPHT